MGKNNYKVRYTDSAENDLKDIFLYFLRDLQLPNRGWRIRKSVRAEIDHYLSYMPQGYKLVGDDTLAALGYRRLILKYGYLAFFIIDEKVPVATVRRIIHGSRDWLPILQRDAENLSHAK